MTTRHGLHKVAALRRRLYDILEHGTVGDRSGLIVGRLIALLIIVNLVAMTLESVPALEARYAALLTTIELLSLIVFSIEYGLRVWVAPDHAPHRHLSPGQARWRFMSSPLGIIDLLAVLPFWIALALPADLRVFLVFRGTIGYGDVVPVTTLGRVVASFTIFLGLIMVALPIGIIATAFADEIHRRDFVVTWGMVARVPLFAELRASEIADIMRLLRAQQVEPGAIIARRGEPAHSMYFVAAGEVEIALKERHIRLGPGHFFGEVAALRRARRSATAVASLLVLDAHDLHALLAREPRVAERIREVVRSRIGRDIVTPRGDIVTEEIEEAEMLQPPEGTPPSNV